MIIKYNIEIDNQAIIKNIDRIINQIFKLLPNREEGGDWEAPLRTLILDVTGMSELLTDQSNLFLLLCKMEALLTLTDEDDFKDFRKTIFECLDVLKRIKLCLISME